MLYLRREAGANPVISGGSTGSAWPSMEKIGMSPAHGAGKPSSGWKNPARIRAFLADAPML